MMMGRGQAAFGVTAILCAALAVALAGASVQRPDAGIVVSVDAKTEVGTIGTRLGTQFVWAGGLDRVAGARARFHELAPPLVRINATTVGPGPVLPAGVRRGEWSFENLESIVDDVRRAGGEVLLTVAYAPEWMWDCARDAIRDPTFAEFGDYMARLVGYFNSGSFIAEDGRRIVNPAGVANRIAYWELWNEPDQLKGCPPRGNSIGPREYVTMWNAAVPKMLGVDPTIRLVGPATASASTRDVPDYIGPLLAAAARKPDVISFHGYGGWLNSQTDRILFDGRGRDFGIEGIERGLARVRALAPGVPVWITELNVNSAWETGEGTERAWTELGVAWGASAFRRLAQAGADAVFQYQFVHPELKQFSLVDPHTAAPLLPYWRDYHLARHFPPGSVLLPSSSNRAGVESLAARLPGSDDLHVLVVNRQVDGETAVSGRGRPATIRVDVKNLEGVSTITVRTLDPKTPLDTGPLSAILPVEIPPSLAFTGYGAAFLTFVVDR